MSSKLGLNLGEWRKLSGAKGGKSLRLPPQHLITHSVIVGMTGSGKTGLVTVFAEEALQAQIPTLIIDVKGDLPNLLLAFPDFDPGRHLPWVEAPQDAPQEGARLEVAARLANERREGLHRSGIEEPRLAEFCANTHLRVITPGSTRLA